MIHVMSGNAAAILPGDVVFFVDKRDVQWILASDVAAGAEGLLTLLGSAYPGAAAFTVDLRRDEAVGIVRGLAADGVATFPEFMKTGFPEALRMTALASEARRG